MSVEAGIELNLEVDLDKPLICEVVWDNGINKFLCNKIAKWQGLAHDEVDDHDYTRILLCGRCKNLAKIKNNCEECDVPVIKDLRKL
jgi:hypothetical protein